VTTGAILVLKSVVESAVRWARNDDYQCVTMRFLPLKRGVFEGLPAHPAVNGGWPECVSAAQTICIVGTAGFEPTTPCTGSRAWRSFHWLSQLGAEQPKHPRSVVPRTRRLSPVCRVSEG
jgi:hypothetical protein